MSICVKDSKLGPHEEEEMDEEEEEEEGGGGVETAMAIFKQHQKSEVFRKLGSMCSRWAGSRKVYRGFYLYVKRSGEITDRAGCGHSERVSNEKERKTIGGWGFGRW